MFNNNNLSFDQTPPLTATVRFFLTGPIFLLLASIASLYFGVNLFDRWDRLTISTLHFFNLGFLLMTIMGALTQMIPVLAGTPIPNSFWIARITHLLMTLGALFFPIGLLLDNHFFTRIGLVLILAVVILFFSIVLWYLKSSIPNFTVNCFKLSTVSVFIMLAFAGRLAFSWANLLDFSQYQVELVELHIAWVIFGVIFTLIFGVSNKVIPMFYVTSEYPKYFTNSVLKIIFFILFSWTFLFLIHLYFDISSILSFIKYLKCVFGILIWIYGFETLRCFNSRKRKILDTTILYWKTGSLFFMLGGISYILTQVFFSDTILEIITSILLGIGLISLLTGMTFKIIPFLTWLHLTKKNVKFPPTMRELLPDRILRFQFYLFLLTMTFIILSFFKNEFTSIFLIGFVLLAIFYFSLILLPLVKYAKLTKK